jgi:N-acyl-D-amino-acid deacylase
MLRSSLVVVLASLSCAAATEDFPSPYHTVIRGARIVDGTGNPWFHGDVAIIHDQIAAIGRIPEGAAIKEIDATGLVIAPGFIDIHSHSDTLLLEDGAAHSKIRQGVTTEILGEGDSAGPSGGKLAPKRLRVGDETLEWNTLGEYFDLLEQRGAAVNVGSYVGQGSVWRCVMGESFDRPTEAQLAEMKALIRQAMDEGALGLSTMLMMPPGSLATTDDLVELCREVADKQGIYSTHIRSEGTDVFAAVKEAIEIGDRASIPVDVIHLKIADQQLWGRMSELVSLIDAARKRGVDVQANVYPYTRGNNNLASIIPPWAHEGGTAKLLERLKDPEQRTKIKRDIRNGMPGWYNHYTAVGGDWSRMLISKETTFKGLTMDRVLAALREGKPPAPDRLDTLLDYLIQEGGSVSTIFEHHTEQDMRTALVQPWCSIGSDGSALAIEGPLRRGNPHPRSFGTFPRILGVYVRELGLLKLEDAIRKMTSLNAAKVGLQNRGLIKEGYFADLVIFDPERVIDKATYTEPFQYAEGIEYMFVNGLPVLERGEPTEHRPGKIVRGRSYVPKPRDSEGMP